MSDLLEGKRIIVTAGASGIGATTAQFMKLNGGLVSVCDVDELALAKFSKKNPDIISLQCDVTNPLAISSYIEDTRNVLGGIDVLVNNAGIAGPTAAAEEITTKEWDDTISVNLSAQFYFAREVIPYLKRQYGGCIINMSSAAGRLGLPMRTPYAAAKWGVIGLTQTLAMELGEYNIRVNAILPGAVEGERMDKIFREKAKILNEDIASVRNNETKNVSMKRMIDPEEIAELIVFLCSNSGRSISGQSLGVCGNTETLR